jgi:hypothetical protein
MRHDQNMVSPLRARVIAVLEQAGYRNSETSLPLYPAGTFSALGGDSGVNVTWRCWDATEAELAAMRTGIAAALRAAGLDVHESDARVHVRPPGEPAG